MILDNVQLNYPSRLPISGQREKIINALQNNQVIVVAGDTGSGKTTQLPKMCLEAGRGEKKLIGCTQPRRIAAISVAARVSEELGNREIAGYTIRFHDKTGRNTRIKFMTDGILLAETRHDRDLSGYDTLIIDEAHERSLNIDFLLGYLHQLCSRRQDLKIIISSATIDTEKFSRHFKDAPIIEVSGRTYPITHVYREQNTGGDDPTLTVVEQAAHEVCKLADTPDGGDILVFMPTQRDIIDTIELVRKNINSSALVLPLYGRLHGADQRKIFQSSPQRKIIVATNVAETSITVPGIRTVIDTGLARIAHYSPRTGTTGLPVTRVSRASCDQRAGRCGRTGPGVCIHLYSEQDYLSRPEFTRPELLRSNLAEVLLQMIALKLGDPRRFPFIDPPSGRAVSDGYRILRELGAITAGNTLTRRGSIMAGLPLDPRISRMIIEGAELDALREVTIIAAMLSIQDPRIVPPDKTEKARQAHRKFAVPGSDFAGFVNLWDRCRSAMQGDQPAAGLRRFCKENFCSWQRMREWFDIHDQIHRILGNHPEFKVNTDPAPASAVHQALTAGFLRNIGLRKEKNLYQASGGREVTVFPGSVLYNRGGQWIVAADFIHTSRLFARTAANIEVGWLEHLGGDLCRKSWSDPRWNKKSGQVTALEKVSLFGLVLVAGRRVNYGRINKKNAAEARTIFIRQALVNGELGGRYPFLEHNLALVAKFSDMEDRLRKRGILVDEQALFDFYDQRLGKVYDRFTLNRLLRRKKSDNFLRMHEDDICLQASPTDELYRFPKTLETPRGSLQLSYRFQPGHEKDGVTVDIPAACSDLLSPTLFEWLVPGLLEEKILYLLKGLPKRLRKLFVPLPQSVDTIMDGLDLYSGSLYAQLEQVITRRFQLTIQRTDWRLDNLPPHLRMRFRLIDERGRVLASGRSFHKLQQHTLSAPDKTGQKNNCTLPGPVEITKWNFSTPPQPLSITGSNSRVSRLAWPALKIEKQGQKLILYYEVNREQADRANREGLRLLYSREFPGELKKLRRECRAAIKSHSASWLSLGMKGKASDITQALLNRLLDTLFEIDHGELPDQATFEKKITLIGNEGLFRSARKTLDDILELLAVRRAVQQQLHRFRQRTTAGKCFDPQLFNEFQSLLEQLVPADFLVDFDLTQSRDTARYLKALKLRIERAEHAPHKEKNKADRLAPYLGRLAMLDNFNRPLPPCCREIALYKKMIEEFRVSLFAPELGTAFPVSPKRLTQQWTIVENSCRTME
jgi:ATP-dependent helicase HrpA